MDFILFVVAVWFLLQFCVVLGIRRGGVSTWEGKGRGWEGGIGAKTTYLLIPPCMSDANHVPWYEENVENVDITNICFFSFSMQ